MEIILYNIDESENVINKSLVNGKNVDIKLKTKIDIISPEIIVLKENSEYNYIHIPELGRYYFINRKEPLNFKLVRLYLTCDVLETYKNDILKSNARFRRNIKNGDYQNISLDYSNETVSTIFNSDGDEMSGETMVISVIGG